MLVDEEAAALGDERAVDGVGRREDREARRLRLEERVREGLRVAGEEVDVGARVGRAELVAAEVARERRPARRERALHRVALGPGADDDEAQLREGGAVALAERRVVEEVRDRVGEDVGALLLDEARGPEHDDVAVARAEVRRAEGRRPPARVVLRRVDAPREGAEARPGDAHLRDELVADRVVGHGDEVAAAVEGAEEALHREARLELVEQTVLRRVEADVAVELRVVRADGADALGLGEGLRGEAEHVRAHEVVDVRVVGAQRRPLGLAEGRAHDVVGPADQREDGHGARPELRDALEAADDGRGHVRVVGREHEHVLLLAAVEEARDAVHGQRHAVDVLVPDGRDDGDAAPRRRVRVRARELAAGHADAAAVRVEVGHDGRGLVGPEHAALLVDADAAVEVRREARDPLVVLGDEGGAARRRRTAAGEVRLARVGRGPARAAPRAAAAAEPDRAQDRVRVGPPRDLVRGAVDREVGLVRDDLGRLGLGQPRGRARVGRRPLGHAAPERELALERGARVAAIEGLDVAQGAALGDAVLPGREHVVRARGLGAREVRGDGRRAARGRRGRGLARVARQAGELVELVDVGDDEPVVGREVRRDERVAVPRLGRRRERAEPDVVVDAELDHERLEGRRVGVVGRRGLDRAVRAARRHAAAADVEVEEVARHRRRLRRRRDDGEEEDARLAGGVGRAHGPGAQRLADLAGLARPPRALDGVFVRLRRVAALREDLVVAPVARPPLALDGVRQHDDARRHGDDDEGDEEPREGAALAQAPQDGPAAAAAVAGAARRRGAPGQRHEARRLPRRVPQHRRVGTERSDAPSAGNNCDAGVEVAE